MEDDWTGTPHKMPACLSVHEFYTPQILRPESSFFIIFQGDFQHTLLFQPHLYLVLCYRPWPLEPSVEMQLYCYHFKKGYFALYHLDFVEGSCHHFPEWQVVWISTFSTELSGQITLSCFIAVLKFTFTFVVLQTCRVVKKDSWKYLHFCLHAWIINLKGENKAKKKYPDTTK